jgi:hypothetical protein
MWGKIVRDESGNILKVQGYKAFAADGTNMYGEVLEAGKKYHRDGEITYGQKGNGYHLAYSLEDTLKFCTLDKRGLVSKPMIAMVIATGDIVSSNVPDNDYIGYYDLFACSDLEVVKFLTREEIISYGLRLSYDSRRRFITYFELTPEEMMLFWDKMGIDNEYILISQFGLSYEQAYENRNNSKILTMKYRG